ncbi:hypothetical protein P280DRAFT_13569 [Massarina eburnea CBS 473.64]|uniref:Uncharacterized protein n=1 Tax=Massarina eburnea CBS 473.64 TaxID=1395130 RepID=A0A6A6SHX1_9PLEO|nr:hypothetical protein P280DRAFT_13569 [Massarina eburnea CBS 473.64]
MTPRNVLRRLSQRFRRTKMLPISSDQLPTLIPAIQISTASTSQDLTPQPSMSRPCVSDVEYIHHLSNFLNSYDGRLEARLSPLLYACFCASLASDDKRVEELNGIIREDFHGAEQVYNAFSARYGKMGAKEVSRVVERMGFRGDEMAGLAERWKGFIGTMEMESLRTFVDGEGGSDKRPAEGKELGKIAERMVYRRGSELFLPETVGSVNFTVSTETTVSGDEGRRDAQAARTAAVDGDLDVMGGIERRMWWELLLAGISSHYHD